MATRKHKQGQYTTNEPQQDDRVGNKTIPAQSWADRVRVSDATTRYKLQQLKRQPTGTRLVITQDTCTTGKLRVATGDEFIHQFELEMPSSITPCMVRVDYEWKPTRILVSWDSCKLEVNRICKEDQWLTCDVTNKHTIDQFTVLGSLDIMDNKGECNDTHIRNKRTKERRPVQVPESMGGLRAFLGYY
ncbi:hypothetical protein SADUNF_Sadunf09G0012100 [Salix dunnii]|uniref:Uncharacterized protein n=1 Tax=Salix dunnii TaxID=1413687 RepID=A0A835MVR2_9ROSI|nr:hypothetical protein SADUNF_Sadunf09G0012100 [Salix dunnii]